MKKLFIILLSTLININVFAQAPQKMSYQAVIRNSSNVLVTNTAIGMRVSILQGSITGSIVFQEIYSPNPQTNANGLVTVEIGGGIPSIGTFGAINWATGPYFIKTETDPSGGTTYNITSTQQLLSVPYALYAEKSGSPLPPSITTQSAVTTSSNVAALSSTINANGFRTTISYEYGLTASYGYTVSPSPSIIIGNTNTTALYNLNVSPITTYHYRVKASNAVDVVYSPDMAFTTGASTPDAYSTYSLSTTTSTVQLPGTINANGSSTTVTFEYGTTLSYGTIVSASPSPVTGNSIAVTSSVITGLLSATTYHFRVKAVNSFGTSYSSDGLLYVQ